MLARSDETDLITVLHEGLHEEPRWRTFLSRLQRRTRADHVSLIASQGDTPVHGATQWFTGRDVRAQAQQLAALAALDPTPYRRLRPGRVYSAMELIDPDDAAHTRFRREYLERIGVRHGRFMRVTDMDGRDAWLNVTRAADDFTAADSALLSGLAPHLAIALRTLGELERARFRAAVADDVLAHAGLGWASLDREGRSLDTGGCGGPGSAGERLPPAICIPPDGRVRAVRIGAEDPVNLLILPVPEEPLTASAMPVVVAVSAGKAVPGARVAEALALLFALSVTESRLAVRLAAGDSLAGAASALGLTIETARTYSKRLFAKTGTRGQPDLVRLVLTSVAALA